MTRVATALVAVSITTLLPLVVLARPTPEQHCAVVKQKAAVKKLSNLLRCHRKAIVLGVAVDPVCISVAETKFVQAIETADGGGGCVVTDDATVIEAGVDACVTQFLALTPATTTSSTVTTTTTSTTSTTSTSTTSTTMTTLPGPRVLVVAAAPDANIADVQTKLAATGVFGVVDTFAAATGTPTLTLLQQYQSVLVFSDSNFVDSATLGTRLADYFDGGGRVVVATFANASVALLGRWSTGNYHLIGPAVQEQPTETALLQIVEPASPLAQGVVTLTATAAFRSAGMIINGGVAVVRWGSGDPLIVRGAKNGRAYCALNFYPPSSDVRADFWHGDGAIILKNSLLF